jgi:hypothetical protein
MRALTLVLLLALTGCCTPKPEQPVMVRIERVVTPIPQELLTVPAPVPALTADELRKDDRAVARWMFDSEMRAVLLESQLRRIAELYVKQVKEAEEANKAKKP